MKNKLIIPLLLILAGIISYYSWTMIQQQIKQAEKTIEVLVPSVNISAYTVIANTSLEKTNIPVKSYNENYITSIDEIENRISIVPLYSGSPIDKRYLSEKTDIEFNGKQLVSVRVNHCRSANAKRNDVIDVYWVKEQTENFSVEAANLLAVNAILVDIFDSEGKSIFNSKDSNTVLSAPARNDSGTLFAHILVEPAEAPYVINGSHDKSIEISFVKKFQ